MVAIRLMCVACSLLSLKHSISWPNKVYYSPPPVSPKSSITRESFLVLCRQRFDVEFGSVTLVSRFFRGEYTSVASTSRCLLAQGSNHSWSLFNTSTGTEYNRQLNALADLRDGLMIFLNNLTIGKSDSIVLQATTLAQLTATTDQLTRNALVRKSFLSSNAVVLEQISMW